MTHAPDTGVGFFVPFSRVGAYLTVEDPGSEFTDTVLVLVGEMVICFVL